MHTGIHRKVLIRLVPVWLALSLLIGFAVYLIEQEKIDDFVMGLAASEVSKLRQDEVNYLSDPTPANIEILKLKAAEHVSEGAFVIVEFYDRAKNKIVEIVSPDSEEAEAELDRHAHEGLMTGSPQYEKIHVSRQMIIRVMTPLYAADGGLAGYFEGAYRVDMRIMKDIQDRVFYSVLMAAATVFITTVVLYPIIIVLNRNLFRYSMDLSIANIGMLEVLGNAIAKRDSDTSEHNYRVSIYSIKLAEALGLNRKDIQLLIKGAFLHDVGKIAISDTILLKPGELTAEEFEIMKTHVSHGEEIIRDYPWLSDAREVIRNHHEKWSGSGYCQGLRGSSIPVTARIFAVIDVFDALTSKRPYKKALPLEESLRIIREGSGEHFDPVIAEQFHKIAPSLYSDLNGKDEQYLKEALKTLINDHFLVLGGPLV